jgi:hypothetical protein
MICLSSNDGAKTLLSWDGVPQSCFELRHLKGLSHVCRREIWTIKRTLWKPWSCSSMFSVCLALGTLWCCRESICFLAYPEGWLQNGNRSRWRELSDARSTLPRCSYTYHPCLKCLSDTTTARYLFRLFAGCRIYYIATGQARGALRTWNKSIV